MGGLCLLRDGRSMVKAEGATIETTATARRPYREGDALVGDGRRTVPLSRHTRQSRMARPRGVAIEAIVAARMPHGEGGYAYGMVAGDGWRSQPFRCLVLRASWRTAAQRIG